MPNCVTKVSKNGGIPYEIMDKTARQLITAEEEARKADANRKKFVRYKEGAELYSMCQSKFERMAKEAKAIYKVDKVVLVNCDIFEEYLETFRLEC